MATQYTDTHFGVLHSRDVAWHFKLDMSGDSFVKMTSRSDALATIDRHSMQSLIANSGNLADIAAAVLTQLKASSQTTIPDAILGQARRFVLAWLRQNWRAMACLRDRDEQQGVPATRERRSAREAALAISV